MGGLGGGLLKKQDDRRLSSIRGDDNSPMGVPKFGKEVSFQDTSVHSFNASMSMPRKRNATMQPRTIYESVDSQSPERNIFPPFIPDDPEKPHLSSSSKERERRTVIKNILRLLLRHNKEEWTDETMKV